MRLKASAAASEEPPGFDVVLPKTERGCSAPMRRLLFPLALLLAMLAVPATGHAYTLGVSDQQASTFTNPLFAPLKIKAARYITPYDVMDSPSDLAALQAWVGAARAANQRILVHFERSHRSGQERKLPSVTRYRSEIKKF